MLSQQQRITRGIDYRHVVRRGARCAGTTHVMHVVRTNEARPPRFGFIVSKAVGNAVTRNTVRRRLKAICLEATPQVRQGADIVIRALPIAATTPFAELRSDILRSIARRAAS
ncbi:ribonuclease P protein component [Microbacterium faecale]|uniref:Ribonuclease P protein component n=1 Tax=Microbacterium faecale TaxID=1804630 RepID=A0A916Y296_9MICO|nr:ribonuclease P protein component [Microbacterium faecale]GGD27749.1 ribonuclease P protein component [Microbacterium faecale]